MSKIFLDLNNPVSQQDLFNLSKAELIALFKTLKKISQLTWIQLYQDKGLKWEMIPTKESKKGEKIYTFRIT